jgi:hypothetical protein
VLIPVLKVAPPVVVMVMAFVGEHWPSKSKIVTSLFSKFRTGISTVTPEVYWEVRTGTRVCPAVTTIVGILFDEKIRFLIEFFSSRV